MCRSGGPSELVLKQISVLAKFARKLRMRSCIKSPSFYRKECAVTTGTKTKSYTGISSLIIHHLPHADVRELGRLRFLIEFFMDGVRLMPDLRLVHPVEAKPNLRLSA